MKNKEDFKKELINKPVICTIAISGFLMLVPFVILLLLRLFNWLFRCSGEKFLTRLDGGIDTWFSFYGSYFGVIATVALGVITLRLSVKIDEMSQASKINAITVRGIRFYDLWRDLKPSIVEHNISNKRYCFQINFDKYQLYYSIKIKDVEWGFLEGGKASKEFRKIKIGSSYFEKKEEVGLYIFCDELEETDSEKTLNFYYHLLAYEPITMKPDKRKRNLRIYMEMENKLFDEHPEKFNVILETALENKGYKDNGIELECSNYDFKIEI